jgi:hypothetical protein
MSDQPAARAGGGDLQFDRAERAGATAAAAGCTVCKQPLAGTYFEINGKVVCPRCRGRIMAQWQRGSGSGRFWRALGLGAVAAALGAGLYFGIAALTGYELGLVAVVVGFLVGAAVRKGSNGRGGGRYQLLAMFLTYSAIVVTDSSLIVRELRKESRARADSTRTATDTSAGRAGAGPQLTGALRPSATVDATPQKLARGFRGLGVVLGLLVLLAVAYAAPIAIGVASPLHLLIAGIALYEAWKLNKGVALRVTGPYQATPQPGPA